MGKTLNSKSSSVELDCHLAQGAAFGEGCYKVRLGISSKEKGKRGGGRVITCVKVVTVYLLAIYDKAKRDMVKDDEFDNLLNAARLAL